MKITKVGRDEHRAVSAAVIAALDEVAERFGVTFASNGGQIGAGAGMIKLTVSITDTGGGVSAAQATFERHAPYYGIGAFVFGKTFHYKGAVHKVVGFNPHAPKYPVICERIYDGTNMRFPVTTIKREFMSAAAA